MLENIRQGQQDALQGKTQSTDAVHQHTKIQNRELRKLAMQAIEFEVDAKGRMIEIPEEFEAFASKHLKVKISMDDPSFEEQLEIGREFMREYSNTFHELAK